MTTLIRRHDGLFWRDLGANSWVPRRDATRMPRAVAEALVAYLRWVGVDVEVVKVQA